MTTAAMADVVGVAGALLVVVAYFLNLRGTLTTNDYRYSVLNLCGSAMIVYSLAYNPNPASLLIEAFWVSISLYGLLKSLKARRRALRAHRNS
ncbi:hypothetical protein OYT13_24365 [Pandoraea sp. XJJ-1]|nr:MULTISPECIES: hypothetical protein [unclassified Pandoraea]WAL82829.1 hypothetical protein OYT13_24365 [Pandoraea sp. XJJ-1]